MELILNILEQARLAASPSEALTIADAIADLDALADALTARGFDLCDVPEALASLQALTEHARTQPFDATDMADGTTVIDDVRPGAFADWLADLDRLAR